MHSPRADNTEPLRALEIARWDLEADVVVVGLGAAGACAALGAVEGGADVVVLEAAGAGGGTSAMAGGLIYMGGGTPIQQACGFEDTPEEMFRFLVAATGPGSDEAKIRVYCDGSVAHYHWLVEQGVPFKARFYPEPGTEPPTDDGLVYSGGEDAWPFDRVAHPAPRGHKPQHPAAAGGFLMRRLLEAVDRSGARVHHGSGVDRLVVDEQNRVVGLVARRSGSAVAVGARRGVVLSAGGFVQNDAMVGQHCPGLARCLVRLGTDHDDGRAIRMAQALGAGVIHMESAECAVPITPPRRLVGGILVNGHGQRFINEDTYYGRVGQALLFHEDGEGYLIVDEELYEVNQVGMAASWACETVEELEDEIGLPEGSLQTTLELYNRHASHGQDPMFHKSAEFVRPLIPPLGAYDLRVEKAIYATFTLGGLATDVEGRVKTVDGTPIPGLFAAGRTTSGIAASGYASGLSLGDATFFGRSAGRGAALPPGSFNP